MLSDSKELIELALGKNHVRLVKGRTVFTSKLIDGRFPEYRAVIPKGTDKHIQIDREAFTRALQRASILSNEKYRGIRFKLSAGLLHLQAHNPEQDEAEEEVEVDYSGDDLTIGFNVGYVLDVLNVIDTETVLLTVTDPNSSAIMTNKDQEDNRYVIMPMRL